jgi:hypothetical protein
MSDHWGSPSYILEPIKGFLGGIGLDPANNDHSITHPEISWYGPPGIDALTMDWRETVLNNCKNKTIFFNPPYSKPKGSGKGNLYKFTQKAKEAVDPRIEIIALLKYDPSTNWWRENILLSASAVCKLYRRVRHISPPGEKNITPNFPSCLVYWGERVSGFCAEFSVKLGSCEDLSKTWVGGEVLGYPFGRLPAN